MNVKLLAQIADHISTKVPAGGFDMLSWVDYNGVCGTTCCIGGDAVILSGGARKRTTSEGVVNYSLKKIYGKSWQEAAKKFLKISGKQAGLLFNLGAWPLDLRVLYRQSQGKERNRVAALRIARFIATDGRE